MTEQTDRPTREESGGGEGRGGVFQTFTALSVVVAAPFVFPAGVAFAPAIFAARNSALLFVRGVIGGAAMLLGLGLAFAGGPVLVVSVGALE